MALYTSLTGLNAAQTELSTISNNIANVGSNGFKRSRAEFGDIIATSPLQNPGRLYGSGTGLKAIKQEFSQGAIQASLNTLDIALTGEGFFAVRPDLASPDVTFTRNGSFSVDANRYVVGTGGTHLLTYPVNQDGAVITSGIAAAQPLRLPLTSGEPRATGNIDITVNLPSDAEVIPDNARYTVPNPYVFDRNDQSTYNFSRSTTTYDSLGNPTVSTLYYVRTKQATSGSPTSTWDTYAFVGDQALTTSTTLPGEPIELTFNGSGVLTSPAAPVAFRPFTPTNGADPITIVLDHGDATTQRSDPFTVQGLTQDGYASGRLDSVSVGVDGLVSASFTNGQTQKLGKVVVASFANPNGLKQVGDAHYATTGASGDALLGEAGTNGLGTVLSGSVERSNVDVTEELVNLITAQRNFQANAKAIETDNTMTQAILNLRG